MHRTCEISDYSAGTLASALRLIEYRIDVPEIRTINIDNPHRYFLADLINCL